MCSPLFWGDFTQESSRELEELTNDANTMDEYEMFCSSQYPEYNNCVGTMYEVYASNASRIDPESTAGILLEARRVWDLRIPLSIQPGAEEIQRVENALRLRRAFVEARNDALRSRLAALELEEESDDEDVAERLLGRLTDIISRGGRRRRQEEGTLNEMIVVEDESDYESDCESDDEDFTEDEEDEEEDEEDPDNTPPATTEIEVNNAYDLGEDVNTENEEFDEHYDENLNSDEDPWDDSDYESEDESDYESEDESDDEEGD